MSIIGEIQIRTSKWLFVAEFEPHQEANWIKLSLYKIWHT